MLTGEYRYRVNWRGKCILQVLEKNRSGPLGDFEWQWRDAKVEDLRTIIKHQERNKGKG